MLVRIPHPGEVWKARARRSRKKSAVLKKLEKYLVDEQGEPIEKLCRLWDDQKQALSYKEIRQAILRGELDEDVFMEFTQDYSTFVDKEFAAVWMKALSAGAMAQPALLQLDKFYFETEAPGAAQWIASRGASFVTRSSEVQQEAIRALLAQKMTEGHTVDELARLIRPCVGLTAQQSAATVRYYDTVLAAIKDNHPRMKAEAARVKALESASRYAEKAHRYRAATIAQTELAFSFNRGADLGIRQAQHDGLLGPMVKMWCTSGDDAVCDVCAALDGTIVGMDETFEYDTGRLLFAGQKMLPPAHPRCGCTVEYVEQPADYWQKGHR